MRAYTERDARLASEVIDRDDEVDKLYKRSIKLLQGEMRADPEIIRPGHALSFRACVARTRRRPCRKHRLAYQGHDRRRVSTALPRSEFAVTRRYVYLNHASAGVLALSSITAIEAFARTQAEGGMRGNLSPRSSHARVSPEDRPLHRRRGSADRDRREYERSREHDRSRSGLGCRRRGLALRQRVSRKRDPLGFATRAAASTSGCSRRPASD